MTSLLPKGNLEISEKNRSESAPLGSKGRTCTLSRFQVLLCVIVAILLIALMGILMAMFGPGSKDLKYHDCKGKDLSFFQLLCPSRYA